MKVYDKCETWDAVVLLICAIGLGKIMIGEKDWRGSRPWASSKAIRYQPAATSSKIVLVASPALQRLGNAMAALLACAEDGKWSLFLEKPAVADKRPVHHFDDEIPSVRHFLFKQRRIYRHRDATGKLGKR